MTDEQRFEALNEAIGELLSRQRSLEERLARLEQRGQPDPAADPAETAREFAIANAVQPSGRHGSQPPSADGISIKELHEPEIPSVKAPAMETRVGLTIVNRLGVFTLILGVGFFFKWAADNDWIGPVGRVFLGLIVGFTALALADYLWTKGQQVFAQGVAGGSIAILFLSLYAASGLYHLIPQFVAFALMAAATALCFALALRYTSPAMAVLGLLGGYLTPFLLSPGGDHPWFLLAYVLLLDSAALVLKKRRGWRVLETLAFAATTLIYFWFFSWFAGGIERRASAAATLGALAYYALFLYAGSDLIAMLSNAAVALELFAVWNGAAGPFFTLELPIALSGVLSAGRRRVPAGLSVAFSSFWICAGLFMAQGAGPGIASKVAGLSTAFAMFFVFTTASEFMPAIGRGASTQGLWTFAANGGLYFALAYPLLRGVYQEWVGPLALALAGVYFALAAFLRWRALGNMAGDRRLLSISLAVALAFVTLAIPIELTGFRITIGWAIQAAVLTWIAAKLESVPGLSGGALLLIAVALRLVFFDASNPLSRGGAALWLNPRFLTFLVAALAGFCAAKWSNALSSRIALGEYLGGHLALLAGLTLEVLSWARESAVPAERLSVETVSVSILFAAYALALVAVGVASRSALNRISGLALIGLVIVKLYLFDVWQLTRGYRIAAFVALGLLLLGTSFLYSRFRHVVDVLLRGGDAPGAGPKEAPARPR